ncbi:MAG: 5'/3'-nucleotidase SurE [Ardenticatenia bacterium]|nr:5'/3'-nucleotidase SurE [Ardenticatenia bacterium]
MGVNITVSGTIGAAIEGATFGVPGLAVSLEVDPKYHLSHSEDVDFSVAAHFSRHFVHLMLAAHLPRDVDILKLDIPADATPTTPWRLTRLSRQRTIHSAVRVKNGRKYLDGYYRAFDADSLEPDSDVYALAVERVVSLTPLSIDLTSRVSPAHLLAALNGRKSEHG